MKFRTQFLTIASAFLLFVSCNNDDDTPGIINTEGYANGILVSHEGGNVSGSVSFVSADLTTTQNDIYNAVNQEQLGAFQQSVGFTATDAYIIVDDANKITVVDRFTFEKKATITEGLKLPRYISFSDGKGYVTNWGDSGDATDDFVAVINLETNLVENTISVTEGPEQIVNKNGILYVTHKGGYGLGSVLSIIDVASGTVSELELHDRPDGLLFDGFDMLWVLCHGNTIYGNTPAENVEEPGAVFKVNTETNAIADSFYFTGSDQPGFIKFDNGTVYYSVKNSIYEIDPATETFPGKEIVTIDATSFYGMEVRDSKIYVLDASGFTSSGNLRIYDQNAKTWTAPITLGVGPSKVYFN